MQIPGEFPQRRGKCYVLPVNYVSNLVVHIYSPATNKCVHVHPQNLPCSVHSSSNGACQVTSYHLLPDFLKVPLPKSGSTQRCLTLIRPPETLWRSPQTAYHPAAPPVTRGIHIRASQLFQSIPFSTLLSTSVIYDREASGFRNANTILLMFVVLYTLSSL